MLAMFNHRESIILATYSCFISKMIELAAGVLTDMITGD